MTQNIFGFKMVIHAIGSLVILNLFFLQIANANENQKTQEVAVYYFPNWHTDEKNALSRGSHWTEWTIIRQALPKFSGHMQPKIPVWGYSMEDNPAVMAQKIEAAASHGVNAFIFDWYYNENGPYLEGALDNGYLKSPNHSRIKFALMWANHKLQGASGEVTKQTFETMVGHIVKDYFADPSYWLIDGKPYFSIYEIGTFIKGMGGVQNAKCALDSMRASAIAAGYEGMHLNIVDWQIRNRPDAKQLLQLLGADSVTSYTWVHHVNLKKLGFPTVDYMDVAQRYMDYAKSTEAKYGVQYFPNVIMGWDPTPRMNINQPYDGRGYPNTPIISGNTPQRFQSVLKEVKNDFPERIVMINAWNEWGEGSYLEPDTLTEWGYLDAIRDVFAIQNK